MEARAIQRYARQSPRKMRLVVDLIRGKNVNEAYAILKFSKKLAARQIEKTLRSAVANASYVADERNVSVDVDQLYVARAFVDLGPTKHRRRRRPAPMGRAYSERRWRSHITIEVSTEKPRDVAAREEREANFAGKKKAAASPKD